MAARGNRDELVIATKVGMKPDVAGLGAATIAAAAGGSLERLQTDRIDLYYAHADDTSTPLEETLGAFDALVQAGKVRHLAASNYSAELCAAREIAVLPYFGLAKGFLTGKYRPGGDRIDSPRAKAASSYLVQGGEAALAALDEVAAAHEVPVAAVALAWLAAQETVVAPIASARAVEQLRDLLPIDGLTLSAAELQQLDGAVG